MNKFKKFLKMFNIFEINLYSKSYKSSLIRIAVSLSIMLVVCLIRFSITIENPIISITSAIIILAVLILAILCFFVAVAECVQVGENIKRDRKNK